ncbi:MAG: hypothetical protein CMM52_00690 [Rhodospirillaceae bacterium]|nr:hypothetical protein [Rhodospirillaceae bacterium]|tara:strand:- start:1166 stop:2329 length:1164 start_codon:yes stop_codon:yes gene_type:complete
MTKNNNRKKKATSVRKNSGSLLKGEAVDKNKWMRTRTVQVLGIILLVGIFYSVWLYDFNSPDTKKVSSSESTQQKVFTRRIDNIADRIKSIESELEIFKSELKKNSNALLNSGSNGDQYKIKQVEDIQRKQASTIKLLSANLKNLEEKLNTISSKTSLLLSSKNSQNLTAPKMAANATNDSSLNTMIKDLEKRVGILELLPDIKNDQAKKGSLLLAIAQLRGAVEKPGSFKLPLVSVQSLSSGLIGDQKALNTLKVHSIKGVKNFPVLRQEFQKLADDIVRASYLPKRTGWVDKTLYKLSKLISFRRTGPEGAKQNDVAGKVARAEIYLVSNDLRGAVAIIKSLSGDAAVASRVWTADAEARIAVDEAIDKLLSGLVKGKAMGLKVK